VVTQNPRVSPANYIREHAARTAEWALWAHRNRLPLIDVYRAFVEDGRAISGTLVSGSDGIHPVADGSQLWRDTVLTAFDNYA